MASLTALVVGCGMTVIGPTASAEPAPTVMVDLCGGRSYHAQDGDLVVLTASEGCSPWNAHKSGGTSDWIYYITPPDVWGVGFLSPTAWTFGAGLDGSCAAAVLAPDANFTEADDYSHLVFGLPLCGFGGEAGAQQNLVYESMGKSGDCDASHGWLPSWQEWANEGKGGPVCERTLLYSDSAGDYVVGQWNEAANKYVPWDGASV